MNRCECGAIPIIYTYQDEPGLSIRCEDCWAETEWSDTIEEAIERWNNGDWDYQEPIGSGVLLANL